MITYHDGRNFLRQDRDQGGLLDQPDVDLKAEGTPKDSAIWSQKRTGERATSKKRTEFLPPCIKRPQ